ncbi:hypothetical protein [Fodinibius salsisoli]|uniref:DUF350 domain-containing protein n=1 Tax=Fodinibius salsisoli TaxID=2820877 RepID=A0ABT3PJK0_9BACT|nr:hypothetical protein [Fodinibius salsisoli]MCW9706125.1 hypothetical protein [Fodinibius salsisoli]
MDNSTQILIIGGMLILTYGFLLGIPIASAREKASRAPRYLMAAHLAALIQGGMLLALTIAFDFSTLVPWLETVIASLFVGGVILFDLGLILNWLQSVDDAFGERSLGYKVSSAGTPLVLISAGILVYGVFSAL